MGCGASVPRTYAARDENVPTSRALHTSIHQTETPSEAKVPTNKVPEELNDDKAPTGEGASAREDPSTLDKICTFYVVDAQSVKGFRGKFPRFQELKAAGHLIEVVLKMDEVVFGAYSHILVVSHCWEDPAYPDPSGKQLHTLQQHLQDTPSVTQVWLDWMSMPQGDRTVTEQEDFKRMLPRINMLFLGCSVLLLVDISYISRFWTQFEAWLAFQACSETGIRSASPHNARWVIQCLHSASDQLEGERLRINWRDATAKKALDLLSQPDVKVTNQSDKNTQLPKIASLNEVVQNTFADLRKEMEGFTAEAQAVRNEKQALEQEALEEIRDLEAKFAARAQALEAKAQDCEAMAMQIQRNLQRLATVDVAMQKTAHSAPPEASDVPWYCRQGMATQKTAHFVPSPSKALAGTTRSSESKASGILPNSSRQAAAQPRPFRS